MPIYKAFYFSFLVLERCAVETNTVDVYSRVIFVLFCWFTTGTGICLTGGAHEVPLREKYVGGAAFHGVYCEYGS